MGGCDEVFDNRGALKRHRTDSHPELDEFKPVDLEPDDPDRAQDLTVACPVCERKFKHKNTCTVHIKTNHLGWTKRKLFECPDCFRAFDNKKAVDSHREAVHLGALSFTVQFLHFLYNYARKQIKKKYMMSGIFVYTELQNPLT